MKNTISKPKTIKDRLEKSCAVCGKKIKVVRYTDYSYRGGHYFCKVENAEYWECPNCYWRSWKK